MKKTLVSVLILVMIVGVIFAAPTVTAGSGLYRIQNASISKGALAFNLHFAGNPAGAYHMNDGNFATWDGVLRLGASWAPLNFLEVGLVPSLGYYKPRDTVAADVGLWDFELNVKAGYSGLKVLKFAVQAKALLPTASDVFFPSGYTNGLDVGGRGLITADFRDVMKFPLLLHLNAGYMLSMDSEDTTYRYRVTGSNGENRMNFGFGFEIPTRFVTLFADLYGDSPGDMWLTPSLRLNLPYGFHVDYGMDFLLFKAEDDPREDLYRTVTMGISWAKPPKKHIPMGSVAGTVKDAETGAGIVSKVSYSGPGTGMLDAGSLGFTLDSLSPGSYTFEAIADGYENAKLTISVLDMQTTNVDLKLKPLKVTLSGSVHDRETDAGIPATIRFVDGGIADVKTGVSTGLYNVQLKPGTYGIEVSSEGYLPQTASVIVSKTGATKDFKLVKVGMKIAFRGINFETAKATILSESYSILDEAAQILKDNPKIRVEIGGHTDSRGSASYNLELSQDRAAAVRLYLIEIHGIEPNRMIAKGYGETQPVAPNDTDENMFKNRRVEFTILSQ